MSVVLRSGAAWAMQGASLDLDFAHARAAFSGVPAPLAGMLANSNSTGGYVTWADGHVSLVPANTPRISDLGLLCEMADSNIALWSNDLTNAVWAKANVTAALNQTGPDLVSNSASLLTATANNATVLQSITASSAGRFLSVYIKRVAGSGAILITQDSVSYTDVTSQLNASIYTRVGFVATLANPIVGIKIGTSGDQIAVWCVDEETTSNNLVTSPIVTTSAAATRSADQVSVASAPAQSLIQGAAAAFAQSFQLPTNGWSGTFFNFGGGAIAQFNASATQIVLNNGAASAAATLGSGNSGGVTKAAFGMDASGFTAIANGGATAVNGAAWAGNTGTIYLGFKNGGGVLNWLNGYLQRFAAGPAKGQFDSRTL